MTVKLWMMGKEERKKVNTLTTHFNLHYNRSKKYTYVYDALHLSVGHGYDKELWCLITNTARAIKYGAVGFALPLHSSHYKSNSQKISNRKMRRLVDSLEEMGYLELYVGGVVDWKEMDAVSSKCIFTDLYMKLWQGVDVSDEQDVVEVVEIKDREAGHLKATKGVRGVAEIRKQMLNFNSLLSGVSITHNECNLPVQMYKRSFIDNLTTGGRMYNTVGGVQVMGQEDRAMLKLNGKNVVELDFKAIHASLLFEREWQENPEAVEEWIDTEWRGEYNPYGADLSFINVDQAKVEWFKLKYNKPAYDPVRSLQKRIVVVGLNAKSYPDTVRSITSHYRRDLDKQGTEEEDSCVYFGIEPDFDLNGKMEFRTGHCVQAVVYHNSPIAKYFFKDQGVSLQYLDSEILSDVMSKMIMQGNVLLPEHDSVIVTEDLEETALQYMKEAYLKVMGSDKFCHIDKK